MNRRRFLGVVGPGVTVGLAGCTSGDRTATDDGGEASPTPTDGGAESPAATDGGEETPSSTPAGVPVTVTDPADQPDAPVEYGVEMAEPRATGDHPARVRVTITNPTDSTVALGEERTVQFHHVTSTDGELYLHPAGDEDPTGPVEPGCWRLTEPVAIAEYYGIVELDPGETNTAESLVYGHSDLPEGVCLPSGDHRIEIEGVSGDDAEAVGNGEGTTEFTWGFTLGVGE